MEAPDGTVLARTTIHRAFEFVLRVEEDVGVAGSIDAVESFDYDAFGRLLGNSRTEQDVQVYTMERELIFAGGYVVGMVERIDQDGDGQVDDT